MANFVNKLVQIGVGRESSRGTAVAPGNWVKNMAVSHDDKRNYIQDDSAMGLIMESNDSVVAEEWGEGELSGILSDQNIGYFLLNVFGAVSSATASGETVVYEHTFSLLNSNQHPSLTLEVKNPVEQLKFALAMVETLKIRAEVGKWVEFTVTFKSKKGATASNSVTYADENKFWSKMVTMKLASTLSGLGAASETVIRSFEITFDCSLFMEYKLGSTEPNDINNQVLKIEGNIEAMFGATTLKDLFRNGTLNALQLDVVSPTVIGNAEAPELLIKLARCAFEEFEKSDGKSDMAVQSLKFAGLYSISDSQFGTIVLTNKKANYTT